MTTLQDFTIAHARPLPVVLLVDVSGSMLEHGKIQSLNQAVREMLEALADEHDLRAQIQVAVITFGERRAELRMPLTPAARATWTDATASGNTPMGAAFEVARGLVEDRDQLPARAYRPTLVLVSDGQPNDAWEAPLAALLASERGDKAFRMAMGIGGDADLAVLQTFLGVPDGKVFTAADARQIRQFFRLVTMTVASRSRSANPNTAPSVFDGWDV